MRDDDVLTVKEVAEHFKVPEAAVTEEIAKGKLRAINVGGYQRVLGSDLSAYKAGSTASAKTGNSASQSDLSINLSKSSDFIHKWPQGKKEQFSDALEGTATYLGRSYAMKLGFTTRESAGKMRRRSLVIVDRYPTVEFVSAGKNGNGPMASIIKDRSGKQVPVGAAPPAEYERTRVGPYKDVVIGAHAANGLAVICDSHDVQTMVRHALIRYRYREERR